MSIGLMIAVAVLVFVLGSILGAVTWKMLRKAHIPETTTTPDEGPQAQITQRFTTTGERVVEAYPAGVRSPNHPIEVRVENPQGVSGWKIVCGVLGIAVVVSVLIFVVTKFLPKQGKQQVVAPVAMVDPCAKCSPDESVIGLDTVHDDGTITWKWLGPCVWGEGCSRCEVPEGSCVTENDTAFASKCACKTKQ